MKQFGHYWEIVHDTSGVVVNSGFIKGDHLKPGVRKDSVSGFHERVTSVYVSDDERQVENEEDIADSYKRGIRDFIQGGRLRNPYNKITQPFSHNGWAAAVKECLLNNKTI